MLTGMIALGVTFLIPFVVYLLTGASFSERLAERSHEHMLERLAQHKEQLGESIKIHKLASQGEPRQRAA